MKALVKEAPGRGLSFTSVPDPVAGEGEVLLEVGAACVCGSDVARYRWTRNYDRGGAKDMTRDLPRVLGHEFAGTVRGVGAGVETLRAGIRVAVRNILACDRCDACIGGFPNVCSDRRTIGVHIDGGYAERVVVPAGNCDPIPDDMSLHLAAAIQPFAVATHALDQAEVDPGDTILVWGLGPIGLATALAARARGVETAAAFDLSEQRLADAGALGLPAFHPNSKEAGRLDDVLGHRSVDALVDAAGAATHVLKHLRLLRKRAPVVLVGNQGQDTCADLMPLIMDEQRVIGSRSYGPDAWKRALATVMQSDFESTLGDEVPLEGAIHRFELAAQGRAGPFTILPQRRP